MSRLKELESRIQKLEASNMTLWKAFENAVVKDLESCKFSNLKSAVKSKSDFEKMVSRIRTHVVENLDNII